MLISWRFMESLLEVLSRKNVNFHLLQSIMKENLLWSMYSILAEPPVLDLCDGSKLNSISFEIQI